MSGRRDEVAAARTAFDVLALTETLRRMATVALALLLGPACGLDREARPGAAAAEPLAWLLSGAGAGDRRTASAGRRLAARHLVTTPAPLSPPQASLAAEAARYGRRAALGDWIETRLRGAPRPQPPEAGYLLWPVSLAAWGGFDHRHRVAVAIRAALRLRLILLPPPDPVPLVAPETFWLLIAGDPAAWPPARGALKAVLTERIGEAAQAAAESPGWAGFWDQWLLSEASRAGRDLPAPVQELPVIAAGAAALTGPQDTDPQSCAPDWRAGMPGYAGPLLAGRI